MTSGGKLFTGAAKAGAACDVVDVAAVTAAGTEVEDVAVVAVPSLTSVTGRSNSTLLLAGLVVPARRLA
jgi:hypothetical protein